MWPQRNGGIRAVPSWFGSAWVSPWAAGCPTKKERDVNKEQITAVIVEFVREVDGVTEPVSPQASLDTLGVDSMGTMDLLMRVEKEFGVAIPDDLLAGVRTISDLVDLVASAARETVR